MPEIKWLAYRTFSTDPGSFSAGCEEGAKLQLRHIAEILFAPCDQHGYYKGKPRHDCPACLAEFKKTAGL